MTNEIPRMSAPVLPDEWTLPGKPEGVSADVQDAYRQTGFQLGDDLRLLAEGMNLQLALVRESSHSRFRSTRLAAMLLPWSRAFLGLSDATLLVTRGGYASCPALARGVCEMLAASAQLGREELPAFEQWAASTLRPDEGQRATDVGMGHFFAGSTIAVDPMLDPVYRAASDLARPHIGAALLLTAPESGAARLALTFGDRAFHFGWAQLVLGWLLALNEGAIRLATTDDTPLNVADELRSQCDDWRGRAVAALAAPSRCTMTRIDTDEGQRWLVAGFRRQESGAPRKFLL